MHRRTFVSAMAAGSGALLHPAPLRLIEPFLRRAQDATQGNPQDDVR